jgi:uncharacterized protein (TIGR02444 family)
MDTETPLWQFATNFYAYPNIANQLLALQDDDGCQINQLILSVWLASDGHCITRLPYSNEQSSTWQQEIIVPIRSIRQKIKQVKISYPLSDGLASCYQQVLAAELAVEKIELAMLYQQREIYAISSADNQLQLIEKNLEFCWGQQNKISVENQPQGAINKRQTKFIESAVRYVKQLVESQRYN